jgi:hypothetical protein
VRSWANSVRRWAPVPFSAPPRRCRRLRKAERAVAPAAPEAGRLTLDEEILLLSYQVLGRDDQKARQVLTVANFLMLCELNDVRGEVNVGVSFGMEHLEEHQQLWHAAEITAHGFRGGAEEGGMHVSTSDTVAMSIIPGGPLEGMRESALKAAKQR